MTTLEARACATDTPSSATCGSHYVEAGEGPLVVLLHGFPEFWFSWRFQIPALAAAGFHVVAPDMRGYNLSSRPAGVAAYATDLLAADVRDLIRERGADRAFLVGHDWGAGVAWATATNHPEVVERLAILNGPHPRRMLRGLRQPAPARQVLVHVLLPASVAAGAPPAVPAAGRRFAALRRRAAGGVHAAGHRALRRGVVAAGRRDGDAQLLPRGLSPARAAPGRRPRPVLAPTLVIWGERDRHVGPELAEPDPADVPNLERVARLPDASHWVQHDEPERVGRLLIEFFAGRAEAERPGPTR